MYLDYTQSGALLHNSDKEYTISTTTLIRLRFDSFLAFLDVSFGLAPHT
jgi:hypothetical protein